MAKRLRPGISSADLQKLWDNLHSGKVVVTEIGNDHIVIQNKDVIDDVFEHGMAVEEARYVAKSLDGRYYMPSNDALDELNAFNELYFGRD